MKQTALPILNTSYNENGFSYWLAKTIASFAAGQPTFTDKETEGWHSEFEELERRGAYFFSSTPVITEAMKVS